MALRRIARKSRSARRRVRSQSAFATPFWQTAPGPRNAGSISEPSRGRLASHFDFSCTPILSGNRLPAVQAKSVLGLPGDRFEREADAVAARLDRTNSVSLHRPMRAAATSARIPQDVRLPGRPLSVAERAYFEPRLEHDLGGVRLHADAPAMAASQALNARAFTIGRHVFFGAGRYAPHTSAGRSLLAHELTHVVQQGQAAPLVAGQAGASAAASVPQAAAQAAPTVQPSFISFVVKMGAKQASKGILKNFIKTQIKVKIKKIAIKKFAKRFAKEADDLTGILEDPWWATAIGFIPVVGDAFDLVRVPKQIQRAMRAADRLEARVKRILRIQGRRARDLIPESLKRVKKYPSELEHLTYSRIVHQASSSDGARKLKKLIEETHRLMEK